MNLVKWLRKNNKKVMAVVVIVILFMFIGGGTFIKTIQQKQHNKRIGSYAGGRKITRFDLQEARQELDKHENGKYFTFCMGVAETQTGDALAMYPQAEINAKAVRRHYELLQIEDANSGQKTA